ncbi:hypothetical protein [Bradyrhizobium sp. CIR3A]|uniref:hypothetical protein n=1 Tax=Bradyrhizobium sp. CIR3A TaxID=2663838 RepID=UPI001605D4C3|nr:hypothetical protein [Bradyrhizobium sp. CIR3A]MBB4259969.1 hypothetical protein [Bradyrhizobium sp. CIR3A]
MKPGGWKHRSETRERISATRREQLSDPAERAKISEATKLRMADPAVRQRIREGMRKAAGETDELRAMRAVWKATRPAVRMRFLSELLYLLCSGREQDRP